MRTALACLAAALAGALAPPFLGDVWTSSASAASASPLEPPSPSDSPQAEARPLPSDNLSHLLPRPEELLQRKLWKHQVQTLFEQLDSAKLQERVQAQRQLERLGSEILPLLPEPDSANSEEQKERLLQVRQRLYEHKVNQAIRPRLVTLRDQKLGLADVLRRISEQTGNPVIDFREQLGQPVDDVKLELHLVQVPFWKALDEITRRGNLEYFLETQQGELGFITARAQSANGPRHYAGPLRLKPKQLLLRKDLESSGLGTCDLMMEVLWEPRLHPLYLKHSMKDVKAWDNQGVAIPVADAEADFEIPPLENRCGVDLVVRLQAPPRGATALGKIQGKLLVAIPVERETFRFERHDQGEAQEIRRAGLTLRLEEFQKDDYRWLARLVLTYDASAASAFESYRAAGSITHNEIYLENRTGQRFELNGGYRVSGLSEQAIDITYFFNDLPGEIADYSLVYRSPVAVLEVPITYEFSDIALP